MIVEVVHGNERQVGPAGVRWSLISICQGSEWKLFCGFLYLFNGSRFVGFKFTNGIPMTTRSVSGTKGITVACTVASTASVLSVVHSNLYFQPSMRAVNDLRTFHTSTFSPASESVDIQQYSSLGSILVPALYTSKRSILVPALYSSLGSIFVPANTKIQ